MKYKKSIITKSLSLFLGLLMILSLIPTTAFAATTGIIVQGIDITTAPDNTVQCGEGSAVYDKESKTITLTNATIEASKSRTIDIENGEAVTIVLVGDNIIKDTIFSQGSDITITSNGTGTLNAQDVNHCTVNAYNGNLTVKDCKMVLNAYAALCATKTLKIENSNVKSLATDAVIFSEGDMIINNSTIDVEATTETNAISCWGTFSATDSTITSKSSYPALFCNGDMTLTNCTSSITSPSGSAIYTDNDGLITFIGGELIANGYWCGINGTGGVVIDGTKVSGISTYDSYIFSVKDVIVKNSADITAEGYYCGLISRSAMSISDSKVNATSTNNDTGIYATNPITIDNSDITSEGYNGIGSQGAITATDSTLTLKAPTNGRGIDSTGATELTNCTLDITAPYGCIGSDNITTATLKDCTGTLISKNMAAIHAVTGVTISGDKTDLTLSGKARAIYANGNITIDGGKIDLTATSGDAIDVCDGKISINANITANAPIVAYTFSSESEQPADTSALIEISDNRVEKNGAKIASTGWFKQNTQWALINSFIASEAESLEGDLSNAAKPLNIVLKDADYSKVDAAIKSIPADLSVYTDETAKAVMDAKNAVVTGKDITEQAVVDAYAVAIESAVSALTLKPAPIPTPTPTPTPTTEVAVKKSQKIKAAFSSKAVKSVAVGKKYKLSAKASTKLTYKSSNKKVATVDKNGVITIKGKGKVTITITANETSAYKKATKKVKITVKETTAKYKTKYNTNYRKDAGMDKQVIDSIKKGKTVTVIQNSEKKGTDGKTWVKVKISGKTYYMSKHCIKKA